MRAFLLILLLAAPFSALADVKATLEEANAAGPEKGLPILAAALAKVPAGGADYQELQVASCWLHSYSEPAKAVALAEAEMQGGTGRYPARMRVCRGYAYENLEKISLALEDYEAGVQDARRFKDDDLLARALVLRGEQRMLGSLYADALEDLKAAYDLALKIKDIGQQRYALNAIANVYADRNVREYERALDYYGKLLAVNEEKGDVRGQATSHFNIASTLESKGDLQGARKHFEKALLFDRGRGVAEDIAFDERAYAVVLSKLGEHRNAIATLNHALALYEAQQPRDARAVHTVLLSRGGALRRAGRYSEALADLEAAFRYFGQARNLRFLEKIHEERALAFAGLGDWRNAYEAQQLRNTAQQEVQRQLIDERTTRLRLQFEADQAKLRNSELEHRNALQQAELASTARVRQWQVVALGLSLAVIALLCLFIARQVRAGRRMRDLAMTDELTRLPNRRHFMAVAREAFTNGRGTAVTLAAIDIDHFKRINDTGGHAVGDVVLQRVAHALRVALRPGDLIGRIGGEEFMVLLRGAAREDAIAAAQRLREAVQAIDCGDLPRGIATSISVGVAERHEGENLDVVCQRADTALYQAKQNGRNRVELAAA